MKDVIRSAPVRALGTNRDIAAAAGWHVLTAVAGLVASHAVIADRLIPFGLSVCRQEYLRHLLRQPRSVPFWDIWFLLSKAVIFVI